MGRGSGFTGAVGGGGGGGSLPTDSDVAYDQFAEAVMGVELPRSWRDLRNQAGSYWSSWNGSFHAQYFVARNTQTVTQLRSILGLGGGYDPDNPESAQMFRIGIYSVDADYNLTQLTKTANEVASIDGPWDTNPNAGLKTWDLLTPFNEVAGTMYATVLIWLDGPSFAGSPPYLFSAPSPPGNEPDPSTITSLWREANLFQAPPLYGHTPFGDYISPQYSDLAETIDATDLRYEFTGPVFGLVKP